MSDDRARLPNGLYWLFGIVIGGAGLNAMVMEIWVPSPTPTQYRIVIIFLCFALSSIAALLFASSVKLEGKLGAFGATIVGSAGLWLFALLVIIYVFPEEPIDNATDAAIGQKINEAVAASKVAPRQIELVLFFPPDPNNPDRPDPRAPKGFENALKVTGHVQHSGSADDLLDPTFHVAASPGALVGIFPSVKPDDQLYVETFDGVHRWRSYPVLVPPSPVLQMVLDNGANNEATK
jgi:hypothetical protein